MNWPDYGIHEGVCFEDYRADDITRHDDLRSIKGKAVSKSLIVDFMSDPAAWKASPDKKATRAMRAGSLLDCLLTTPREMDSRYAVQPQNYISSKKEEKPWNNNSSTCKNWKQEREMDGVEIITGAALETARAQMQAIKRHPDAMRIVRGAKTQVAFRHKTRYGFDAKGLIDFVPDEEDLLADLKTCEPSALESRRSLQRYIFEWGYHIQAGGYCEGYSIASEVERSRFKFIFVTSKPPFQVAVIELPLAAIIFGADQYRGGMKLFGECLQTDRWPGKWDHEMELDLPEYAYLENEQTTPATEGGADD